MDQVIATKSTQIERKIFHVEFRENDRGQFMRITEESHGRRNTLIVPSEGLEVFLDALEELLGEVDHANKAAESESPAS